MPSAIRRNNSILEADSPHSLYCLFRKSSLSGLTIEQDTSESMKQSEREDMRLHQQCWPKYSVLLPPWPKLLVLALCLLFTFLYCRSPVTGQNKNGSVEGRTGRVIFTFRSRDTLDGLKMLVRSNASYYRVPFFPSAPQSDAKKPGVLVSHVPYICSQGRK